MVVRSGGCADHLYVGLTSLANIAVLMLSPEGPLHDSASHSLTVYNPILREKIPYPIVLETYCRSYC